MTSTDAVNYVKHGAEILGALEAVEQTIDLRGIEPILHHLVKLRASQINECAYCVKLHTRDARKDGETDERLDLLVVWRHVDTFTAGEKAALAWTEALTGLNDDNNYAELRAVLRLHFSEGEISTLTAIIAMINLWNRMQISNH